MGSTGRSVIAAAAAVIALVSGGTIAAATPDVGALATFNRRPITNDYVNNLATDGIVKTTGGVFLSYSCNTAGNQGDVQVQLTNVAQTQAYRTFPANCTGSEISIGWVNAPSNTLMRARIHAYSGPRFVASVFASGTGYCFDIASSRQETC